MAVYLIDGNSYLYRAFFAIRGLNAPDGRPTNAVFGFTSMLLKLLREKSPDTIAVCFDTPHPTARHRLYEAYKAHRPETPQELISQHPLVREVLSAMDVPVFECPGFEADDVLATLARKAVNAGLDAAIVTSDKDMLQIVGEHISVYDPMKDLVIGPKQVRERFGVGPERVPEYMALVGDAADNIPGVKGIGDKTAKELLAEFASLNDLMAGLDRIKRPRTRELLKAGEDALWLSLKLAAIHYDAPVGEGLPRMPEPDQARLMELFRSLGFTSLMRLVREGQTTPQKAPASPIASPASTGASISYTSPISPAPPAPPLSHQAATSAAKTTCLLDASALKDALSGITGKVLGLDTETGSLNPMAASLVGYSFCGQAGEAFYVPLAHRYLGAPEQIPLSQALDAISPLLGDEKTEKAGHNLKFDILVLSSSGVKVKGPLFDTMIASHLLNPERMSHSLGAVALEHLGRAKRPYSEVAGKGGFGSVELSEAAPYAAEDAALAFELRGALGPKLRDAGLWDLFSALEMPLLEVLVSMEEAGVKVDSVRLRELSRIIETEMVAVRQRAWHLAGGEFNLNSPKQLGRVLFDELGLKPGKKKKTGYSTDAGVLEELAREHELPAQLLLWRTLSKLKSTYTDVLPTLVNPRTGRVHTSFNQAATSTGRLSSSDPNLQNIPVRGPWGQRIRECFIAESSHSLISADYSQIELRILAHLSRDQALTDAFLRGHDVHTATAAYLNSVAESEVTVEMRRAAKTVNFGVIYGMSGFGLSESLGIPRADAERYIDGYFKKYEGVARYIEQSIREASQKGYVETMMGRRRPMPELKSSNRNTRQLGERLAVNTPVQGTAADIIKKAMLSIHHELKARNMRTRMILQVHDELLFEAPESETEAAMELVKRGMEGAANLSVPLTVEAGVAKRWSEAH